jgi:SUMO ligase MMS21 Smc5/6 complex component
MSFHGVRSNSQCIFCSQYYREGELISMTSNCLEIDGEIVDFEHLLQNLLHCKVKF